MNKDLVNSEKFIAIYNEIDSFMRSELKENMSTSHTKLIEDMVAKGKNGNKFLFKLHRKELKKYADLRNAIVHDDSKRDGIEVIAEPHGKVVEKYQNILNELLNPPLAIEKLAIPQDKIYTTRLGENALDIMKIMNKYTYTHVPVIENEKMVGIFSENTIFSYISESEDGSIITDELKIKDFIDFIPVSKHVSEIFEFVPRKITVPEIEDIFRKELNKNKRIAAIFITQNGRENEKILGLITPWDVAGYNE